MEDKGRCGEVLTYGMENKKTRKDSDGLSKLKRRKAEKS